MPRLNYTGRKKLNRNDISIVVSQKGNHLNFDADLSLSKYNLPEDAYVFIEAYRRCLWMRYPFGTISNITKPNNCELNEFDDIEGILFRVKVTDTQHTSGKLLAFADRLKPYKFDELESNRECILPVKSVDDIEEIWKVEFDNNYPILLINSKAGSRDQICCSKEFITLVYPAIIRSVLQYITSNPPEDEENDNDIWKKKWLLFAESLPGTGKIPEFDLDNNNEDFDEWVDGVVIAFARKYKISDIYCDFIQNGD